MKSILRWVVFAQIGSFCYCGAFRWWKQADRQEASQIPRLGKERPPSLHKCGLRLDTNPGLPRSVVTCQEGLEQRYIFSLAQNPAIASRSR